MSARHNVSIDLVEEGSKECFEARIGVTNVFVYPTNKTRLISQKLVTYILFYF